MGPPAVPLEIELPDPCWDVGVPPPPVVGTGITLPPLTNGAAAEPLVDWEPPPVAALPPLTTFGELVLLPPPEFELPELPSDVVVGSAAKLVPVALFTAPAVAPL